MHPDDVPVAQPASPHSVQFYDDARFLVQSVADFLGEGLAAGEAAVVVASARHLTELERRLVAKGVDVAGARSRGHYVELEAAETLAKLVRNGLPDRERFDAVVTSAIRGALDAGCARVRAFGEMVSLLWAAEQVEAALRLERMWSDLVRELPLSIRCGYPIAVFSKSADSAPFAEVCDEHSEVLPAESYSARARGEVQLREIARLQQRATALEAELERGKQGQESLARLAEIVGSSDDAIVGKALDGTVTSWNASAERIFGFSAEEMVGSSILRIIPPERHSEFETILATVRRGERVHHFETERIRKDGVRIDVSVTVSPIRDTAGRIIGASKIARDVTERRRLEVEREQLLALTQRARADVEAASALKDEFLATLSHELRNPLSAVRSAVVSARLDTRDRERALEIAYRQTEQLSRLVDDLLDLSRIAHGRVRVNRQQISLKDIIERAAETTRFLIEERGHTLRVVTPPDAVRLEGDPVRLEQVVVNLLANAAKYTERGGRIELRGEQLGQEAVIRVRDNGNGIAPDVLPRVFDLFVQARRTPARTAGGLGIGLTVVRSLVSLHGGRVEAHSEGLGKGAEFVVFLPCIASAADEAPRSERSSGLQLGGGSGFHILVVEDNSDAAEGLMLLLEVFGNRAEAVGDGFAALDAASADVPDLMLVDVGLPGMDGYELAQRIRQTPLLRDVPLVALTGYARREDRARALAAGFDQHLAKPVDPNALRELVGRLAGSARRRAGDAESR